MANQDTDSIENNIADLTANLSRVIRNDPVPRPIVATKAIKHKTMLNQLTNLCEEATRLQSEVTIKCGSIITVVESIQRDLIALHSETKAKIGCD